MSVLNTFLTRSLKITNPDILELGTKRSIADRSTLHKSWFTKYKTYIGTDISAGADVDIVADLHTLSSTIPPDSFDIIVSCSTFEHLKNPFKVAIELDKVLRTGGMIFIQTHFMFPEHAYPHDYFRYTKDGLAVLFEDTHIKVIKTDYGFPSKIISDEIGQHDGHLNTCLFGIKS